MKECSGGSWRRGDGAAQDIVFQRQLTRAGARPSSQNDLTLEDAKKSASQIAGHAVAADISDPTSVSAMFAEVSRLDILVNYAGISGLEFGDVDD